MGLGRRLCAVVAVLLVGALAPAATAGANEWPLQAYWPLLEGRGQTVYDISGRGHHGKLGRLPGADKRDPEWIRGLLGIGSALRLDGNDFIEVGETERLKPQRVTIEAWVRAPRSPGQWKYVAVKGGDRCEAGSFGLYTSINGGMAFYVYDGRKWWRSPQVGTEIWDNRWHHVAGTYDGAKVRLFVDGMEIGTGRAFSGSIEYALEYRAFTVGAFRGACNLTFAGDVDEVRLWSAALPVAAIWGRISAMLDVEPAAPLPEDAREWYDGG
jgi:Concanavalin A-like lectin/glucanases superfamily